MNEDDKDKAALMVSLTIALAALLVMIVWVGAS